MIRYNLVCNKGHEFEGWFKNSAAFDEQKEKNQLQCAVCGSKSVSKALMAPNLGASAKKKSNTTPAAPDVDPQKLKEVMDTIRKVRDEVTSNSEYVGDRFAEEARKMHYEETESRGVYGEATIDEAKELAEEGVPFQPLPTLPEDQN